MSSLRGALVVLNVIGLLFRPYPVVASDGRRVALVIGNSKYDAGGPLSLSTTANDANEVADALERLNFKVIRKFDLDWTGFDSALADFQDALADASVGLVYFAGHALHIGSHNYLMPIGAKLESLRGISFQMMSLENDVIDRALRDVPVKIVILDASHETEVERQFVQKFGQKETGGLGGLGPIPTDNGLLVAYADAPGHVVKEGTSRDSLFTRMLTRRIGETGIEFQTVLDRVGKDVRQESKNRQQPAFAASPTWPGLYLSPGESDEKVWNDIASSNDSAKLQEFVTRFPTSQYRAMANERIEALQQAARERAAQEQAARERAARDKAAKEQAAREQAAKEQAVKEQAAKEQAAREKAKYQAAKEQAAKDQAAKEQAAKDQAAKDQAVKEQAARDQAAKEQAARDQAAKDQAAKEQAAKDQAAKEQAARDQAAKEQAARDQAAKDQAAKDQAAKDQAAKDQAAKDQAAKDQAARDQAAKDQAARDQAAKDQAARDQAAKDQPAKDQAAKEQAAKDQAAKEQAARDRSAREQAARNQAAREQVNRERARKEQEAKQAAARAAREAEARRASERDAAARAKAARATQAAKERRSAEHVSVRERPKPEVQRSAPVREAPQSAPQTCQGCGF